MSGSESSSFFSPQLLCNVGFRLSETARQNPHGVAIAVPKGRDAKGRRKYDQLTFRELDDDTNRIAAGLHAMGVRPGTKLVLMVPPSIDFVALVFALFKAGVVQVLIDPGMGRANLIRCLAESQPEGFVGIPLAQALRVLLRGRFPQAKYNVTVGRRWFWGGKTLAQLKALNAPFTPPNIQAQDPAAIIFTTGSTGPPKGVLYSHGNFNRQADEIRDFYHIQPGEVALPAFPLFALFNCAMGVTTIFPEMDPTRPANVDPRNIIEAVNDWQVDQSFGSPALWNVVGRYCEQHHIQLPSVTRVLSAGAPVPPHVLERVKNIIHPEGDVHTPYGATEALPVASIAASEVLRETRQRSATGAGTCVGRRFPGIEWKVIAIDDGPLTEMSQVRELAASEIGELIVTGPVVTSEYVTRTDCNPLHKIRDGARLWHRMGDVGYLEPSPTGEPRGERFWFCGRKAHRVTTPTATLFTIQCEAIFNQHPRIYRSALVGVGAAGKQRPVIIAEPWPEHRPQSRADEAQLIAELKALAQASNYTQQIETFFIHNSLPVDIRHNAKIFREQLAIWAAKRLQ
ncbi:Long-chain-fatty-acid--CoA ligase [Anatilimnocola aggregata]|uniref:Long-chain-fatty-acid--CoA ligase n=1 Tax=Anatilimnocola aggregata TaxID=2528021 RepID=A0A517Y5I8_9BACT|nr:fatty acid CoA ligase family protein [Anatilimnocola aggregata]QDU25508.1 Long-chain-fatty-acid--CoA ligase [Anatilimnocola aggregata]